MSHRSPRAAARLALSVVPLALALWLADVQAQEKRRAPAPPNRLPRIACDRGARIEAPVGQELAFALAVDDPEGGPVRLRLLNPPAGLVFDPLEGAASPARASVRWLVPATAPERVPLVFVAQDESGGQVRFEVELAPRRRAGSTILTGDVTGDGIDDVIAAAPQADRLPAVNAGAVYVWAGGGVPSAPTAVLVLDSPQDGDRLGMADEPGVTLFDLNNDGTKDVIVTAPFADENGLDAGAIYAWFGGSAFTGTRTPDVRLQIETPEANDRLGRTAPLFADVNGDGIEDVIAWSSQADLFGIPDTGAIYVWEGGVPYGGTRNPTATLLSFGARTGDQLGQASGQGVLVGDVTGDGIADIVAAAPSADGSVSANLGEVYVWNGGFDLIGTVEPGAFLEVPGAVAGDQLGRGAGQALQLVDLNDDGTLDVLVAAQFADRDGMADAGAVYVWFGGNAGFSFSPDAVLANPTPAPNDQLGLGSGQGVVVADLNGDTVLDVVVGSTRIDGGAGALFLWQGPLQGSMPAPRQLVASSTPGDQLGLCSGQGILVGDVTGDTRLDLVVGAMLADLGPSVNTGAVYVWRGRADFTGVGPLNPDAELSGLGGTGDQIGNAPGQGVQLADVTGDGILDVIVAAPLSDRGGVVDVGVIHVFPGDLGIGFGIPLFVNGGLTGDQLGNAPDQSVQLADLNGDGVLDIVAGCMLADLDVPDAGAVHVWKGALELSNAEHTMLRLGAQGTGDRLGSLSGRGIQFADLDDDGLLDVVAGASRYDGGATDTGGLFLWRGPLEFLAEEFPDVELLVPGALANDQLGQASLGFQFADLDGDAVLDLLVGAEFADVGGVTNTGALYLWLGGDALGPPDRVLSVPGALPGDRLGSR